MLFPAPSKRAFLIALPRWRIKSVILGSGVPKLNRQRLSLANLPVITAQAGTGSILRAGLMNAVAGATQAANNRSASKVIPDLLRSA